MSNMSYCRFRNTANDLRVCVDNISEPLDHDEDLARKDIVELARRIVHAANNGFIPGIILENPLHDDNDDDYE